MFQQGLAALSEPPSGVSHPLVRLDWANEVRIDCTNTRQVYSSSSARCPVSGIAGGGDESQTPVRAFDEGDADMQEVR